MKVITLLMKATIILTLGFCALDELNSDRRRDSESVQKRRQRLGKLILKNLLFSILITGGIGLLSCLVKIQF